MVIRIVERGKPEKMEMDEREKEGDDTPKGSGINRDYFRVKHIASPHLGECL